MLVYLLKYDLFFGKLDVEVIVGEGGFVVDGKFIIVFSECNLVSILWCQCEVDIVIEVIGLFMDCEKVVVYIYSGGVKCVIIFVLGKNDDLIIVMGVNESFYFLDKYYVISNGSCIINGFVFVVQVLYQYFGIKYGLMNIIYVYINSQVLYDQLEKDLCGVCVVVLLIVFYFSGVVKVLGKVIFELDGCLMGYLLCVFVLVVFIVDFIVMFE